jgi:hypothetical protein
MLIFSLLLLQVDKKKKQEKEEEGVDMEELVSLVNNSEDTQEDKRTDTIA